MFGIIFTLSKKLGEKIASIPSPLHIIYVYLTKRIKGFNNSYFWFKNFIFALITAICIYNGYLITPTTSGSDVDGLYFSKYLDPYEKIDDTATVYDTKFVEKCRVSNKDISYCENYIKQNKSTYVKLKRGQFVDFCIPSESGTQIAIKAGLPRSNSCLYGTAELRKHIAGVPGDKLLVTESAVFINDERLVNSGQLPEHNHSTIPLNKMIIIPDDNYYIAGHNVRAYDSRYFGLVFISNIKDYAYLLIPF